jgi:hypothetical protein
MSLAIDAGILANACPSPEKRFCYRGFPILTIDRPAFITNRTDTSVEQSDASVGERFPQFSVQGVKTRLSNGLRLGPGGLR